MGGVVAIHSWIIEGGGGGGYCPSKNYCGKKFIQPSLVLQADVAIWKVTVTENELTSLKEKNRDIETKLDLITFELEESQLKNEALGGKIRRLEDTIEEVLEEKRNLVKDMDKLDGPQVVAGDRSYIRLNYFQQTS